MIHFDEYKESHSFPSGLTIDFESNIGSMYLEERSKLETDNDLNSFIDRWKYLFSELNPNAKSIEYVYPLRILMDLVSSASMQDEFIRLSKGGNKYATFYLNLLLPKTLVLFEFMSKQYGADTGTIALQFWNARCFRENSEGFWTLTEPSITVYE